MHFETVTQAESPVALSNLPEHSPDNITLKLVTASEINAHEFVLEILGVPNS